MRLTLPADVTELRVEGRLYDRTGDLLQTNDARIYPLFNFPDIETAADAKIGL